MKNRNSGYSSEAESTIYTDLPSRLFSAACSSKLEELKNQLLQRFTIEFADVQPYLVNRAVNEAQALATLTTVPHLFLPTLAEEKLQGFRDWTHRQRAIFQQPVLALAA